MNEAQRVTLQRHYKQLSSDIILTEDLIGNLCDLKVFELNMIEIIKAQRTRAEQVQKMLEWLPKRGPHAFDGFVDAIENDYPWLASILQASYESERTHHTSHHKAPVRQDTVRSLVIDTSCIAEPDTKKKVSYFVHRQFGTSKRISQNDKKALEKWLNEQLNEERKRLLSLTDRPEIESVDSSDSESEDSTTQNIQQELYNLHIKLEDYLLKDRKYKNMQYLPEDMTFETVSKEVDVVLKIIDSLEKQIQNSLQNFSTTEQHKPLSDLVESLVARYVEQEDIHNKDSKHIKELHKKLDEYLDHIDTVENQRKTYREKADILSKEVSQLRNENYNLQEKCSMLEKAQLQHLEKEKTLLNLKKMVGELQASQTFRAAGDTYNVGSSADWYNQRSRKTVRVSTDRVQRSPARMTYGIQMSSRRTIGSKAIPKRRNSNNYQRQ
ncbi:uncharacterized protein LOC121376764 [Gigantopelta aegis]|uniref:uncharacterized protein LOC121376764 n=1 Tax=Gigantopelta aegis TaxID=1735272 RepID=UPI001B88883C|nr:uncharacterized protein LOC121376764 [Gigantopelta aegis]